jgi:hypothetical protein
MGQIVSICHTNKLSELNDELEDYLVSSTLILPSRVFDGPTLRINDDKISENHLNFYIACLSYICKRFLDITDYTTLTYLLSFQFLCGCLNYRRKHLFCQNNCLPKKTRCVKVYGNSQPHFVADA